MPKASVRSSAEETAANCADGLRTVPAIHFRAVSALVIVSMVVKVFDATTISVVSGFSGARTSWTCAPSTFETKCARGPSE